MPTTKAVVKYDFSTTPLSSILPIGFETAIIPLSDPTGNYSAYRFRGKDGNMYSDWDIKRCVGNKSLDKLFTKVN